jgi:late competence protein required for DNA uptake (superfamily II DNA/RNA helicase)
MPPPHTVYDIVFVDSTDKFPYRSDETEQKGKVEGK